MKPIIVAAALLIMASAGCMGSKASGTTVSAMDNQFSPNTVSAKQNDEITFKNDGTNLHSVTIHKAGDPVTTTKKDTDIAKSASTDFTFEETGTYHVYCKYHSGGSAGTFGSGMVLTVTVT